MNGNLLLLLGVGVGAWYVWNRSQQPPVIPTTAAPGSAFRLTTATSIPSPTGQQLNPFQQMTQYMTQLRAAQAIKPQCQPGYDAPLITDPATGALSWGPCQFVPLVQ